MALLSEACLSNVIFWDSFVSKQLFFIMEWKILKEHIFKGIFSSKFLSELHLSKDLKRWKKFCKKFKKKQRAKYRLRFCASRSDEQSARPKWGGTTEILNVTIRESEITNFWARESFRIQIGAVSICSMHSEQ